MDVWNGSLFHCFTIFLKKAQLHTLGVTDNQLFFLFGFLAILLFFWVVRPLIRLLILLQWNDLLTYMVGSICLTAIIYWFQSGNRLAVEESGSEHLRFLLLGIVFFGGVLCTVRICKSIVYNLKKKSHSY
ncbi:hypothetical protein [Sediminibacillus albus]|uniref:Uncharacterized protein n=1 Tax=Sediminibacillus albus TaxID=407036 RepID=A0A1G8WDR4_9BACI|nr:hypothetical protein [Sediminibacillus albus]SDJ75835.1 hypothetical protein SAMN05216243_0694 [Sediminibacillus albus]